jgi:hypothetical protein
MSVTRRDFLGGVVSGAVAGSLAAATPSSSIAQTSAQSTPPSIDRQAVLRRNNPRVNKPDPFAALTVGNGNFAFTADVTGLQTFIDGYKEQFPLCTASQWGWHTTPLPAGLNIADYKFKDYDTHGRPVGYATDSKGQTELFDWLRENPHRLHLGRIGFELKKSDGSPAALADIGNIQQELDLFSGLLVSSFELEGKPVRVRTSCHPDLDLVAVSVDSPLLATGQVQVLIAFPYASSDVPMADWNSPDRHTTDLALGQGRADFQRKLDEDRYNVTLAWRSGQFARRGEHEFLLGQNSGAPLEFICAFAPQALPADLPSAAATHDASANHWQSFWSNGGCIDLSNCTDDRAPELERRIVLSQYNTAIHCAGPIPPAETGLLSNSWYGKFHLEMHWWHSAHFAVWNRFDLLNRSLPYYQRIMHVGLATAARQGYRGCRWPKMTGPDGRDSPSPVAPLLIWQQPHPIYYAELSYRQNPTDQTLAQWKDIVFQSAEFMASFAFLDEKRGQYVLGPPLKTVSENTQQTTTSDPTFELAYWRFGLQTAQTWRTRMGLAPDPAWADVLAKLAPLPTQDGMYLMQEGMTDTYTKWNYEHPALLGAFGAQPGIGADAETMRNTVKKVMEVWQWDRAWGWDFPMAAMAAARSGEPELAIKALMIESPKNHYHPNGHVYQRPNLTAYLPANGGLLSVAAMMCAGWTGGPQRATPGFPSDGKWDVRWENLRVWM